MLQINFTVKNYTGNFTDDMLIFVLIVLENSVINFDRNYLFLELKYFEY